MCGWEYETEYATLYDLGYGSATAYDLEYDSACDWVCGILYGTETACGSGYVKVYDLACAI